MIYTTIYKITVSAHHLHNETAFSLVRRFMNRALAPFHRGVSVPYITQSAFEDGKKSLLTVKITGANQ